MKTTRKIGVVTALLVALSLGTVMTSKAQDATPPTTSAASSSSDNKEFRLSVGPDFLLPTGNFNTGYSWAFGGSVEADIPIISNLYGVVNLGYSDAYVRSGEFPGRNLQMIPVKAGFKYFFVDNLIYVQGTAGATILGNKSDAGADKGAGFLWSPQVGVLVKLAPKNYIDAGVYYQQSQGFWNNGGGNVALLGIRLAYTLGL
jgi:hypothetical protein